MNSKYFPDQKRLSNPKITAEVFGTTESKLANDRSRGRGLPFLKIGGSVVYDLDACYEAAASAGSASKAAAA